jgi:hypothetical protein
VSNFRKILLLWVAFVGIVVGSTFLPHSQVSPVAFVSEIFRFLLFLLSAFIVWKEPNRTNKFLFLNYAIFFSFSVLHYLYAFVGEHRLFFATERFASFYYYQYVDRVAFYFFLSLAIVYTVVDSLFRDFRVYQKYVFAILIVGGFAAAYYSPYFKNAQYLYNTEDIQDFRTIDRNAWGPFIKENGREPSASEIAAMVELPAWKDDQQVGTLFADQKLNRIGELYPYFRETNYLVLLWRPMHWSVVKMNVVCVLFLFLFFGYQYKKDPPQGAYIDKIMFLFLLFCGMEVLHTLGYIYAVQWERFTEFFSAGQYITIGILLFMILFFSLRLRFITSVKGEFYESELVHNAQHITRWRDWVDNLVVHYFLNPKALRGRLLALWTEKGKGELAKTAH